MKMRRDLAVGGRLLIGTTGETKSSEGFEPKVDYPGAPARFRRRWTERDFLAALAQAGFKVLDVHRHHDPWGKVWFDVVATSATAEAMAVARTVPALSADGAVVTAREIAVGIAA